MELNASYWDNRYANKDTGWDIGEASKPLVEYVDQLVVRDLTVLIPGAGNAYEAAYLWNQNFENVFVIDISKWPIDHFARSHPGFPKDQLVHQNFFEHRGSYDLIIEQTFFCALNPELRSLYAQQMANLLKPGGRLVGVMFDFELGQEEPPFGGSKAEYIEYFRPYFEICVMAPCYNSIGPRAGKELFINLRKR